METTTKAHNNTGTDCLQSRLANVTCVHTCMHMPTLESHTPRYSPYIDCSRQCQWTTPSTLEDTLCSSMVPIGISHHLLPKRWCSGLYLPKQPTNWCAERQSATEEVQFEHNNQLCSCWTEFYTDLRVWQLMRKLIYCEGSFHEWRVALYDFFTLGQRTTAPVNPGWFNTLCFRHGGFMRQFAACKNLHDVSSLLLQAGDIEMNPGPANLKYYQGTIRSEGRKAFNNAVRLCEQLVNHQLTIQPESHRVIKRMLCPPGYQTTPYQPGELALETMKWHSTTDWSRKHREQQRVKRITRSLKREAGAVARLRAHVLAHVVPSVRSKVTEVYQNPRGSDTRECDWIEDEEEEIPTRQTSVQREEPSLQDWEELFALCARAVDLKQRKRLRPKNNKKGVLRHDAPEEELDSSGAAPTETVDTSAKVTLVSQRDESIGIAAPAVPLPEDLTSFGDKGEVYPDLLNRWNKFLNFDWTTAMSVNTITNTIDLPGDVLSALTTNPTYRLFETYAFFVPQITIKALLNSTRFHQGKLIVAVKYWSHGDLATEGLRVPTTADELVQLDHFILDASTSNIGEIQIPYYGFQDQISTRSNRNVPVYYATVYVAPLLPLRTIDANSNHVSISFWAKFSCGNQQTKFYGLRTRVALQGVISDAVGTVSAVSNAIRKSPATRWVPGLASASAGVTTVCAGVESITSGLGALFKPFDCDKPVLPEEPKAVMQFANPQLSSGVGAEQLRVLRLDPSSVTPHHSSSIPPDSVFDATTFKTKWAVLGEFTMTTAMNTGTILYTRPISPCLWNDRITDSWMPTFVSFLANYYTTYSGALEVKISAAKTAMQTYRLRAVVSPDAEITTTNYQDFPSVIFDMQEDGDFVFELPYFATTKIADMWTSTTEIDPRPLSYGSFAIILEQDMVIMDSVAADVDHILYLRAKPNLVMSIPRHSALACSAPITSTSVTLDAGHLSNIAATQPIGFVQVEVNGAGVNSFYTLASANTTFPVQNGFVHLLITDSPGNAVVRTHWASLIQWDRNDVWVIKTDDNNYLGHYTLVGVTLTLPGGETRTLSVNPSTLSVGDHELTTTSAQYFTPTKLTLLVNSSSFLRHDGPEEERVSEENSYSVLQDTSTMTSMIQLGETFDLKSVCRRYVPFLRFHRTVTSVNSHLLFDVNAGSPYTRSVSLRLPMYMSLHDCYRFARGGMNYQIVVTTDEKCTIVVRHHPRPNSWVITPSLENYSPVNVNGGYATRSAFPNLDGLSLANEIILPDVQHVLPVHVPYYSNMNVLVNGFNPNLVWANGPNVYANGQLEVCVHRLPRATGSMDIQMDIWSSIGDDFSFYLLQGLPRFYGTTDQKNFVAFNAITTTGLRHDGPNDDNPAVSEVLGTVEPSAIPGIFSRMKNFVADTAKVPSALTSASDSVKSAADALSSKVARLEETTKDAVAAALQELLTPDSPLMQDIISCVAHAYSFARGTLDIKVVSVIGFFAALKWLSMERFVEAYDCLSKLFSRVMNGVRHNGPGDHEHPEEASWATLLLTSVVGVLSLTANKGKGYVSQFLAMFKDISMFGNSIGNFITKNLTMIKKFIFWVVGKENPDVIAAQALQTEREEVVQWAQNVIDLTTGPNFQELAADAKLQSKCESLLSQCQHYLMEIAPASTQVRASLLSLSRRLLDARAQYSHVKTAGVKKEGVCVWIWGSPGVGKTTMVVPFMTTLAKHLGVVSEIDPIYTVPNTDHWDNFCGQELILYPDFGVVRDATKLAEQVGLFMQLCSSEEVVVPMAALDKKGMVANPTLVTVCSNDSHPKYNCVNNTAAFNRRRDLLIKVELSAAFKTMYEGKTMQMLKSEGVDFNTPFFSSFDHLAFSFGDPMDAKAKPKEITIDGVTKSEFTYNEMIEVCRQSLVPLFSERLRLAHERVLNKYELSLSSWTKRLVDGDDLSDFARERAQKQVDNINQSLRDLIESGIPPATVVPELDEASGGTGMNHDANDPDTEERTLQEQYLIPQLFGGFSVATGSTLAMIKDAEKKGIREAECLQGVVKKSTVLKLVELPPRESTEVAKTTQVASALLVGKDKPTCTCSDIREAAAMKVKTVITTRCEVKSKNMAAVNACHLSAIDVRTGEWEYCPVHACWTHEEEGLVIDNQSCGDICWLGTSKYTEMWNRYWDVRLTDATIFTGRSAALEEYRRMWIIDGYGGVEPQSRTLELLKLRLKKVVPSSLWSRIPGMAKLALATIAGLFMYAAVVKFRDAEQSDTQVRKAYWNFRHQKTDENVQVLKQAEDVYIKDTNSFTGAALGAMAAGAVGVAIAPLPTIGALALATGLGCVVSRGEPSTTLQIASSGAVNTQKSKVLNSVKHNGGDLGETYIALKRAVAFFAVCYDKEGEEKWLVTRAFAVKGRNFIVPYHYLFLKKWKRLAVVTYTAAGPVAVHLDLDDIQVTRISNFDLALIEVLSARQRSMPDTSGMFVSEQELRTLSLVDCRLISFTENFELEIFHAPRVRPEIRQCYTDMLGDFSFDGFSYPGFEGAGKCGTLLICSKTKKIIGMHTLGETLPSGQTLGRAQLITKDMIPEAFSSQDSSILFAELQGPVEGQIICEGVLPAELTPAVNTRSQITKSVAYGVLAAPSRFPVNLKTPGEERPGETALLNAVKKMADPPGRWPKEFLKTVEVDMVDELSSLQPIVVPKSARDLNEAITGLAGVPFMNSMRMDTSLGWPLTAKYPGKRKCDFIKHDGEVATVHETVLKLYDQEHQQRVKGVVPFGAYQSFCKDERLKPGKQPRLINACSVQESIEWRRYTMDFFVAFQAAGLESGSAIGVAVNSPDWSRLARHLLANSSTILVGDYKNFGPRIDPEIANIVKVACHEWYNRWTAQTVEDIRVRECLFEGVIHARHVAGQYMFQQLCGIPSGFPWTAPNNTIVNRIMLRLAWLHCTQGNPLLHNMLAFRKYIREVAYGDDVILSAHPLVREVFNNFTIQDAFAERGIIYTDADKDGQLRKWCLLGESTFLKHGFLPHPTRHGQFLACLEKAVVEDVPSWIRLPCVDPIQQCIENCEQACRLAYGWGPEYYHDLLLRLKRYWSDRGEALQAFTWKELDSICYHEFKDIDPKFLYTLLEGLDTAGHHL